MLSGLTIVGGATPPQRSAIILLVALVFGIVNAVVKPLVAFLSIPLYILTLGLFTLVVNALMLMLTAWITEATGWGLRIANFGTALLGARHHLGRQPGPLGPHPGIAPAGPAGPDAAPSTTGATASRPR